MVDPIFTPAVLAYFILFTYSNLLGVALSCLVSGTKYTGFWYGFRRKFHIETENNNPKGYYAVLCWLLCHQDQISLNVNTIALTLGPYTIRIPSHGTEFLMNTKYGPIYIEAMGDDNNIGGFCVSTYKRRWYSWSFFGLGAWWVDSDEINKLNFFIKELYESVNITSPYDHCRTQPTRPKIVDRSVQPRVPRHFKKILDKIKMHIFESEDYDDFIELTEQKRSKIIDSGIAQTVFEEDSETAPFLKKAN